MSLNATTEDGRKNMTVLAKAVLEAAENLAESRTKLEVKEVHAIIEACKSNGVSSLRFAGLELQFHKSVDTDQGSGTSGGPAERIREQARVQQLKSDLEDRDAELEMLKVTDPAAYEAVMNDDQEFEDEDSHG